VKSSDIEGETLDLAQVRSSIARRLGIEVAGLVAADRKVDGVVEMMLDATRRHGTPLTEARLRTWQASLFPDGRSSLATIRVGAWRDDSKGPMQVVSGPIGRERVHFTAPPAARVDAEMAAFLDWFESETAIDGVVKAAVAHLWFVTIHPFDDGNGRIARAISDMALARAEASGERFYSVSGQIRRDRDAYYAILERTQKGDLDITPWIEWFLGCLSRAIDGAEAMFSAVPRKARFWDRHAGVALNARQIKVLNRLLDGYDGKLTSSRWARLAGCSQDTAHRDLVDLAERGIVVKSPARGRSASYSLSDA
jgi:Fic family protein